MFTVKAVYSENIEVRSSIEKVRAFFADIAAFADMMPGVVDIHIDAKGIAHWRIEAAIPMIGSMLEKFSVELAEKTDDRIEWFPVRLETRNFLRFSADFLEHAKNITMVHISQMVELRRNSARDLHFLAGLAGESLISSEMSKRVGEMIRIFVQRAKERLEK